MNELDYEGDMAYFQNQLARKGITKEMFDMDRYIGCTFSELQHLVDAVIRNAEKKS